MSQQELSPPATTASSPEAEQAGSNTVDEAAAPAHEMPSSHTVRLVHLSDLHFGWGFNASMWENLRQVVPGLHPDAIIVTGDLVNSPLWWRFRYARRKIEELRDASVRGEGDSQAHPKLYVVAGNHDTRILGVLPIVWLVPALLFLIALAGLGIALGWHTPALWKVLLVLAGLVALRFVCLRKFSAYFNDLIPPLPEPIPELGLVLYPFDSASFATSAACGWVPLKQFVRANEDVRNLAQKRGFNWVEPAYRLALVHHHSLPLPYDAANETMMVLKNAGAFLSEVTKRGASLVLNGHKHHEHFSRVTINAATEDEAEVCVLSTGTPTAGRQASKFGYNFSVVDIDHRRHAKITRFRAGGGTFSAERPFWAESVEASGKAILRRSSREQGCQCDSLALTVKIGPDGDAFRKFVYRGFRATGPDLLTVPGEIGAKQTSGQIERLQMSETELSSNLPQLRRIRNERRVQSAQIELARPLSAGDAPLGFAWEYDSVNSYAMSAQQFRLLYREVQSGVPQEWADLHLKSVPTASASILIQLPPEFRFRGEPTLAVLREGNLPDLRLEELYRSNLVFNPQTNVIFARFQYPPLDLRYRVLWQLSEAAPPAGRTIQSVTGEAREAADYLLALAESKGSRNPLKDLLSAIEQEARSEFGLAPIDKDPLDLSIMVFDPSSLRLRIAASNFPASPETWQLELDYGDGIAGRAYKMNRVSLFVKARALVNQTPFYYVLADGSAPSPSGSEISEEALLSLPLAHPDQPAAVFGVLNLSSTKPSSRLVDVSEERVTEVFRLGVSAACLEAIRSLY